MSTRALRVWCLTRGREPGSVDYVPGVRDRGDLTLCVYSIMMTQPSVSPHARKTSAILTWVLQWLRVT